MEPTTINQPVDINNNHLNIYSVLGLLVFGFFTVTASIVFIDRWNPGGSPKCMRKEKRKRRKRVMQRSTFFNSVYMYIMTG